MTATPKIKSIGSPPAALGNEAATIPIPIAIPPVMVTTARTLRRRTDRRERAA
jgi:hypothetical protein